MAEWLIRITRQTVQKRASDGKSRTVGVYQVFHAGQPVSGLSGQTAESGGPSSNSTKGVRIKPGRYPLATQDGGKYATIGYTANANHTALRKPGIEVMNTGGRSEILIHPGIGFLASIGCINLCKSLPTAGEPITWDGSRNRVIAVIDDMKVYLGSGFPSKDGKLIANAFIEIAELPD